MERDYIMPARGKPLKTWLNTHNSRVLLLWIGIIVLACVVYAYGVGNESVWYDESYSAVMASHPLPELLTLVPYDNHPPLFYLLLNLVVAALGHSEVALRALSVLGAVGIVALGAGPVRRLLGNRTGVIFAAIVLFTPVVLIYAHEARMYTLAVFALTASLLYGYLAVQGNRRRDWVIFALSSLAAAYLHYYGLIAGFFIHAVIFFWLAFKKRAQLKAYFLAAAIVVVGYLPWLIVFIRQTLDVKSGFWLGPPTFEMFEQALAQPFAYRDFYPDQFGQMVVVVTFCAVLIAAGVILAHWKKAEHEFKLSLFMLLVYFATMATTIVVSKTLVPMFYARYMIPLTGLVMLLMAVGISQLPTRWLPVAALVVFAALNSVTLKDTYTQLFHHPMKDLVIAFKDQIQPGDAIVTSDSYSMGPAFYYFPQAVHYLSSNLVEAQWQHVLKPYEPKLRYDDAMNQMIDAHRSFWYITCNSGASKSIQTIVHSENGWEATVGPRTFAEPFSYISFTITQYTYTSIESPKAQGEIHVHVTGLKPGGYLYAMLYNKDPIYMVSSPYRFEAVNVSGREMVYTFHSVPYGDYVLVMADDENKNRRIDVDLATGLATEQYFVLNEDKVDASSLASIEQTITMDNLKFTLHQPEMTFEAPMTYLGGSK